MHDTSRKISKLCEDKNALFRVVSGFRLTSQTRHELVTMINKIDDEIEELQGREEAWSNGNILN